MSRISQSVVVRSLVTRPHRELSASGRHQSLRYSLSELTREKSDRQDTVFCVAFNQRSARMAIARTGKGTRLRTSINIKGDMAYLLLSSVNMPFWCAMPGPEKYLQRRGARSA